jgi:hypothetical protein
MQNVNITTNATVIVPAGNRGQAALLVQNQSDTTMRMAAGAGNIALLSGTLGIVLEAGESIVIEGQSASAAVSAIHAGTGNKVAHWQLV